MNRGHLSATLWLRWRLLANRFKRSRKPGRVLVGVLLVLALAACVGSFALALSLALDSLPMEAEDPMPLMAAWAGLVMFFLLFWMIGVLTDLQRSDAMSFRNFLHLPVSLGWVFTYNYLSSFVSFTVAVFLPAMLGLSLAMLIARGPLMLLSLPLLLGFLVMVTAITYQFRGWLGHLMQDKRRARNVIAAITVGFVLLAQVPNLVFNVAHERPTREERREERAELRELRETASVEGPQQESAQGELDRRDEEEAREDALVERQFCLAALVLPIGWLPYGVRAITLGRWLPACLCILGMLTIGALSLRRAYRKTVLSVVGGTSPGDAVAVIRTQPSGPARTGAERVPLVERSLPLTNDRVAGIALSSLRSLLRAPEAKMLLLGPAILLVLFATMLSKSSTREALGAFAPLLSLGASAMGLLSIAQLIQNQFGLDRAGFRAYVLSPVPRDQILLGKNLATAPLGIGVGLLALGALQLFQPMDLSHFAGACLQLLSAYLLLCLLGNALSILGPMRLKDNELRAANAKSKAFLLQIFSVVFIPIVFSPLTLPSLAEFLLRGQDWARGVPVYLLSHAAGLVAIALTYRWMLRRQGELLQAREQHILEVLTRS